MLEKIKQTTDFIFDRFGKDLSSEIALILGSGLGDLINDIDVLESVPFNQIPHFSETGVKGHNGQLILARYQSKTIIVLQGRLHFYEGHNMDTVTYPVRILKFLGIKYLILFNAAGGMNPEFSIGDLMIINDHINLMPNPLIGKHYPEFGERFPDMSATYDQSIIEKALKVATELNIEIKKGIYIAVTGPTYETPAEYRYFRIIGGDAIGMSTVPEVIVARQMGIKCFAVSVITDLGVPGKIEFLSHELVQKAASDAEPKLARLVLNLIDKL